MNSQNLRGLKRPRLEWGGFLIPLLQKTTNFRLLLTHRLLKETFESFVFCKKRCSLFKNLSFSFKRSNATNMTPTFIFAARSSKTMRFSREADEAAFKLHLVRISGSNCGQPPSLFFSSLAAFKSVGVRTRTASRCSVFGLFVWGVCRWHILWICLGFSAYFPRWFLMIILVGWRVRRGWGKNKA